MALNTGLPEPSSGLHSSALFIYFIYSLSYSHVQWTNKRPLLSGPSEEPMDLHLSSSLYLTERGFLHTDCFLATGEMGHGAVISTAWMDSRASLSPRGLAGL